MNQFKIAFIVLLIGLFSSGCYTTVYTSVDGDVYNQETTIIVPPTPPFHYPHPAPPPVYYPPPAPPPPNYPPPTPREPNTKQDHLKIMAGIKRETPELLIQYELEEEEVMMRAEDNEDFNTNDNTECRNYSGREK